MTQKKKSIYEIQCHIMAFVVVSVVFHVLHVWLMDQMVGEVAVQLHYHHVRHHHPHLRYEMFGKTLLVGNNPWMALDCMQRVGK